MRKRNFVVLSAMVVFLMAISNAYALQCVTYVKQQKPGGYNWDIKYPVKDSKGNPTKKTESWVIAKDLWERLWVTKRADDPKASSVFIIDSSCGQYGHSGIVTDVSNSGKRIKVKHANWDVGGGISTGTYERPSTSTNKWKYTTSSGIKWNKEYKIYGFVIKP